ncbi:MAG: hypothetical protein HOA75_08095 [Deltaproteobacteria bacterium]|nr:hypothetical protein [Deltaproteobacteria bacterium]
MTKAEAYEKAWRLGYKGDFSLVDQIYHPEYSTFEDTTGITANLDDDKTVVLSLNSSVIIGPYKCVSESGDLLNIPAYSMFKEAEIFRSFTTYATYREGKIITQKIVSEELDYDPSEGQDWNWEDCE